MQSESVGVCACKNVHRLETIAVTNLVLVNLGSCKEITKTLEDAVN